MVKTREQILYIAGAVLLTAVLYFGFDTKPSTQKVLEKSRALTTKEFDVQSLEKEAVKHLKPEAGNYLETLESQANHVDQDSQKVRLLKEISGFWYSNSENLLAGMYAKQVAELENTAESWSIAGASLATVLQQKELDPKKLGFARDEAVECFENAISLEPKVVEHRINQALCYIEVPAQEMPMKGIQMLAGLATSFPDSPLPPYHLARLAAQTGQYERAAQRIEQALALDPKNSRFACLAVEIYKALHNTEKVEKLNVVCAAQQ
jgi:tetratricopeptide (TPR) repeat protein